MTTIHAHLYGKPKPLVLENVTEYYETRKALIIVQEDMYIRTTTTIYKQSLQMYNVVNTQ